MKHWGHELWGKRPCAGKPHEQYWKKLTRKIERKQNKKIIEDELSHGEQPRE